MDEGNKKHAPPSGKDDDPLDRMLDAFDAVVATQVDHPLAVTSDVVEGTHTFIYEVKVHPEDVRRLIGRNGRTAAALRVLLENAAAKIGRRVLLVIVEPNQSVRSPKGAG